MFFQIGVKRSCAEDLLAIYQKRYQGEPFVRLYAPGQVSDLRAVARTNFCDLGIKYDGSTRRGGSLPRLTTSEREQQVRPFRT